jgi:hypothetical protein
MLTFRGRWFLVLLGFAVFTLVYIPIGIRWHTYRARAALYARQEVEHTFEAATFARAARNPGPTEDDHARAAVYRKYAEEHERAALECTRLRQLYERSW